MARVYLSRAESFCASHRLHAPELTDTENRDLFGKCNYPNGHGHNYEVKVTVAGEVDEVTGLVMNLTDLKEILAEKVLAKVDHRHLNLDVEEFKTLNPTAENIAVVIWQWLRSSIDSELDLEVEVAETRKNRAVYRGESLRSC